MKESVITLLHGIKAWGDARISRLREELQRQIRAARHPTLGNDVMVGSGAKILGPIRIGDHARVAANAVVLQNVPDNSTVVGVPGRVVRVNGEKLDHVHTPDPIALELQELRQRVEQLEAQLQRKEL